MPSAKSNHAIVYGASGLIGWAVVDELLKGYPDSGSISKITAVTNRPLSRSEALWPEPQSPGQELQLVSGVDLRVGDAAALAHSLKQAVNGIETVTHIYYLVFTALEDDIEEVATNLRMFRNVINAHTLLSPHLQFVGFAGGTRGYGIYLPGGTFSPPLHEDMVKDLPPDYAKTVVYPAYREFLASACKGKKWTWCEVCPDTIIGFTPNGSQFSLSLHWAQYLSLYAYNHGLGPGATGAEPGTVQVPFPGNAAGANALFSPVSSNTIGRFMIYASLHPDKCGDGRLFNIADSAAPITYGEIWPRIAEWFGLVGIVPAPEATAEAALGVGELPDTGPSLTPGEYVTKYKDVFSQQGHTRAVSGGVGAGNRQLDSVGYWLTFDRQMSLKRLRESGFERDRDPVQGWLNAFEMFRKAGLIL